MTLSREQAIVQLHAWTTNPSLLGHIQFVIDALKPHADELGIAGQK